MAASANIRVNGVLADSFVHGAGSALTFTNDDDTDVVSWKWEFVTQPQGAVDGITGDTTDTATATVRKENGYYLRLTVNETLPDEAIDVVVIHVPRVKTGRQIPAAGEKRQRSSTLGWALDVEPLLGSLDDAAVSPGAQVGVASENLVAQGVVRVTDASTIKTGLPGEEQVPTFSKALATTEAGILGTLYFVDRAPDGDTSPESGDVFTARCFGMVLNVVGGPADGAPIYVTDTGTLSDVPGTVERRVGVVTRASGGTYDVWFDGIDDRFGAGRSIRAGDRLLLSGDGLQRLSFGALRFYVVDVARWQIADTPLGAWIPESDGSYNIGHLEDTNPKRVNDIALSGSLILKGGAPDDFDASEIYDDGAGKLHIVAAGVDAFDLGSTAITALLPLRFVQASSPAVVVDDGSYDTGIGEGNDGPGTLGIFAEANQCAEAYVDTSAYLEINRLRLGDTWAAAAVGDVGLDSSGRLSLYIDGAAHLVAHLDEIEPTLKALKTSNESVTSSSLQDDDALSVSLAASTSYAFEILVFGTLAGATEGIKLAVGGSAGVSALKAQIELWDDTTGALVTSGRVTAFDSTVGFTILAADDFFGRIQGTITTSTAGTFKLRWAQNATGGDNTTVQAGSVLEARKVA